MKYRLRLSVLALFAGALAAAILASATSDLALLVKVPGHFLGSYLPLLVSIHVGAITLTLSVWDLVIYSLLAYIILSAVARLRHRIIHLRMAKAGDELPPPRPS